MNWNSYLILFHVAHSQRMYAGALGGNLFILVLRNLRLTETHASRGFVALLSFSLFFCVAAHRVTDFDYS